MLTARVCRCGKDVTRDSLPTSLRGIVACPVCGRGVLDQDDRSRIAWRRTRKVDASLTRFVLQLHAFPLAFLALDVAGLWLERAARKSNVSLLILPVVWCAFAGAWTHFGLGHLRLRARIGFWVLLWLLTMHFGLLLNELDPGHSAVFRFQPHLMNAAAGIFALIVGWPIARLLQSVWQGFRRGRRRKKREQWRRWGVAW
jgi:hypothetical protein